METYVVTCIHWLPCWITCWMHGLHFPHQAIFQLNPTPRTRHTQRDIFLYLVALMIVRVNKTSEHGWTPTHSQCFLSYCARTSKAERSLATSPCFGRGQAEERDSVADVVKHMILGYENTWWLAAFIMMETLEVAAVWLSHKETRWISFGNFSWFAKLPNWSLRQSFHYTVACERASRSILNKTYLRKHLMKFCHVTKTNQWGLESHTPQFIVVQTFDCSSENVYNNIIHINWILESLCMHYTM